MSSRLSNADIADRLATLAHSLSTPNQNRMARHVRQDLTDNHAMLLFKEDVLRVAVEEFLIGTCGVRRAGFGRPGPQSCPGEIRRSQVFPLKRTDAPVPAAASPALHSALRVTPDLEP